MSYETPFYSRRLFLTRGVQLLSVAGTLPLFLDKSAHCLAGDFAANPAGAGRPDDRILVVVQMAGGNDGLNTVVPIRNDHYYRARPRLGVARNAALKATDDFGFHPSMPGFKKLYDAGLMGVLHAVGYPNPNRSHFRSTDIWQTAEPEKAAATGWLGRYFDNCCTGEDPGTAHAVTAAHAANTANVKTKPAEPSAAIALTNEPPQALQGDKYIPIVFRSPQNLTYGQGTRSGSVRAAFEKLNDMAPADPAAMDDADHMADSSVPLKPKVPPHMPLGVNGSLAASAAQGETNDFLQRSALNARVYAETIKKSMASVQNKATYPQTRLASDLKLVAQMIAAGLPTRVYYVQMGGYDTHSQQAVRHPKLMEELSGGITAFMDDLKALGHLDRTTLMTFSEFGRRVAENGSGGTDHGEAAPLLVFGSAIRPGFHGTAPDLNPAKLNRGDVPYSLDFRRLYSTVLNQWLKADATRVLGKKFDPIDLFKNA